MNFNKENIKTDTIYLQDKNPNLRNNLVQWQLWDQEIVRCCIPDNWTNQLISVPQIPGTFVIPNLEVTEENFLFYSSHFYFQNQDQDQD